MKKAIQYFSDEALKNTSKATPEEIIRFLEDFRELQAQLQPASKSKLISLKVPEPLLAAFKLKASRKGLRYQTQIKNLMLDWVQG